MAKIDYFCGECGYMDNKPGNCPNCALPLESIGVEDTVKNPRDTKTYSTNVDESQENPKDSFRQQIEKDNEDWDSPLSGNLTSDLTG